MESKLNKKEVSILIALLLVLAIECVVAIDSLDIGGCCFDNNSPLCGPQHSPLHDHDNHSPCQGHSSDGVT